MCGREGLVLTKHHLIPRTRHANKWNKREFARADVRTRLLWICRPCHDAVHALLTEKELERSFNTREALLAHEGVARFVEWVKRRPAAPPSGSRARARGIGA